MVVVVIMRHAPGSRGVQRRRHRRGFGEPHSPGTLHRKPARCRTEVPLFGTDPAYIHHERRRALGDHQDRRLVRRHPEQGRGGPEYPGHRHPGPEPGRGARRRIHHPRQQRQQPPSLPDGEEHPAFAGRLPGGRHRDNGARRTPAGIRSRRYGSGSLHRRGILRLDAHGGERHLADGRPQERQGRLCGRSHHHAQGQHHRRTPRVEDHDHGRRRRIRREHRRRDHRAGSGTLHAQGHAYRGIRLLQRRLPVDSRQLGEPLHQVRLAERVDRRHERQRVRPLDRRDERGRSGQGLHLHALGICPLRRPCQAG